MAGAIGNKPKERPKYGMLSNVLFMMREAWRIRKPVLITAVLVTVVQIIRNIAELYLTPSILGKIEQAAPLPELLGTIGGFIALLAVMQSSETYLNHFASWDRIIVRMEIGNRLPMKMLRTSYPNAEDKEYISALYRAWRGFAGTSSAAEAIWTTLIDLVKSIFALIIYVRLLTHLHPALMLLIIVTSIAGYLASRHISEWRYRHKNEEGECQKPMRYVSFNAVNRQTAKDIRIFNMQPWLEDVYAAGLRAYEAFFDRCGGVTMWGGILDAALVFLRNGAAYAVLIGMAIQKNLSASEFLLYFSAVGGFSTLVTGVVSNMLKLHEQSMDISAAREFVDRPEQFRFEEGEPLHPDLNEEYELRLKDVSFRYPGSDKDVLTRVNLTIHPGEKLAVVGLNGAGKTTLVKLLCGFYDPTEGEVLLNGVDIRVYNRRDYYRLFSAVFQQFSILETSFRENVTQSVADGDIEKMMECLKKAGLLEKIDSLTNGADTHVGREIYDDGMELSGGETQRLMLARALYKNAPILILDEPTAALDPIAENDIYMKYSDMTKGRTSLFISHRLASTRFCDRILFIDGGVIAEEGTHESLLKKNGKYAELFEVQAQYYREEGRNHE